jgi:hypothetical protein
MSRKFPFLSERHNTVERRLSKLHDYGFNAYTDLIRSAKEILVCYVCDSHSGDYEELYHLQCNLVQLRES